MACMVTLRLLGPPLAILCGAPVHLANTSTLTLAQLQGHVLKATLAIIALLRLSFALVVTTPLLVRQHAPFVRLAINVPLPTLV
jgi:hypothetical protein